MAETTNAKTSRWETIIAVAAILMLVVAGGYALMAKEPQAIFMGLFASLVLLAVAFVPRLWRRIAGPPKA